MIYISEQIEKWTKEGDCIIFIGDLNEYIYMQRVSFFFSKLGPRELIINKHRSGGPASTRYNKKRSNIRNLGIIRPKHH